MSVCFDLFVWQVMYKLSIYARSLILYTIYKHVILSVHIVIVSKRPLTHNSRSA